MATLIVPTRTSVQAYTFRVVLDGDTFDCRILYNAREDFWYLDLRDADGIAIREGIKLVSQMPLNFRIADERRPAGDLMALDTTGQDYDAGLDDLGSRVILAYEEEASSPL